MSKYDDIEPPAPKHDAKKTKAKTTQQVMAVIASLVVILACVFMVIQRYNPNFKQELHDKIIEYPHDQKVDDMREQANIENQSVRQQ